MTRVSNALVIDDIDEAFRLLSGFGQETLRAPVDAIRDAVYRFADRYAWQIVRYRSFAQWAEEYANDHLAHWLVLDPLFVPATDPGRFTHVRTSRQQDLSIPSVRIDPELKEKVGDAYVGVLDDAASSGRTLRSVVTAANSGGLRVSTVLVCASSRAAYQQVSSMARWRAFVSGDWEVMHLRDGFPFLPFAGRPTAHPALEVGGLQRLQLRSSSAHAPGNPWYVLQRNGAVDTAIQSARREVGSVLSRHLGRPATVADVQLLGAAANMFVDPTATLITKDTLLQ